MAVGDHRQPQKQRRKTPSFSSSLLDAMYHSIDDPRSINNEQNQRLGSEYALQRKNDAVHVEEEIESLRRAIMVEKWMGNYSTRTKSRTQNTPGHLSSNSNSSTDSSIFSSVETDSASRSSVFAATQKPAKSLSDRRPEKITIPQIETTPKKRFMATTKTRAMKIYGDLKKVKEPISPGGRIANFLNAIFSPRNLKKNNQALEEWNSVRKSRSMKDTATCSLASRSCLSKNASSSSSRGGSNKTKSKRSVRFCPVSVIVDEDSQPCGHKSIYYDNDDGCKVSASMTRIGSQFINKNIDSLRLNEGKKNPKVRKNGLRELYEDESDVDGMSCASSDLFELENIGAYEEELPVYETTSFKMNQAIAGGLVIY